MNDINGSILRNARPRLTRQLISRMCGMVVCLGFLSLPPVQAAEEPVGNAVNAVWRFRGISNRWYSGTT